MSEEGDDALLSRTRIMRRGVHGMDLPTELVLALAHPQDGGNISRIASPVLRDHWRRVHRELKQEMGAGLVRRGQEALTDEVSAFPLSSIRGSLCSAARSSAGPVALAPPFAGLSEWF